MFGQQTYYSQQLFSEQQFGHFRNSPQSPDSASDDSHFSNFSRQATNTPDTSYASSACELDTRDCSPAPLFATAFRGTALDTALDLTTPSKNNNNNNNNNSQPTGFPTPPDTQQPDSRFLLPTPATPTPTHNTCSQCTTPLDLSHHRPLSCGHATCPPCMRDLFIHALRTAADGDPFSEPRCCPASILPLAAAGDVLDHFEFVAYRERIVESSMPPEERLYCFEERCGLYLRVLPGRRSGFCPLCEERTCTRCGRRSHRGGCAPGTDFKTGKGCRPWVVEC